MQGSEPFNTGPDASPAGGHSEGHRSHRGRFTDIMKAPYEWVRKRLPSPGVQNYAFETLGLVEYTPIGAGVNARQFFAVTQPPQVYLPAAQLPVSGFGGVVPGQMVLQGLVDPYSQTYSGEPVA